ncbi:MAG: fibrobacter succinogenes major paralogous domain-containing protein [Bacteroidales bacterium]|nr:fibrobacter succinogenes major paralogous domain-containing protein [Bacteroidales bacterium]
MNRLISCTAVVALMLGFAGCKEDEPSRIPTAPTSFGIEDGAVVEKTDVKLSASGSTTEMDDISISYEYYIGTSPEELNLTDAKVVLEPYAQYFWKAIAVSDYGACESDVRTFYCVPPLDIETDNGDGEWAAVLRFKGLKKIKGGVVTATPNHEGYEMDPINIPEGQDSCYIKLKYYTAETSNAWVQNFDDEHGVLYEPVIYDFDVKLDVTVGDKTFSLNNSSKEIILDKQSCVRDHEFNVYRLVKIGSQTWLADDLRTTTYFNEYGDQVGNDYRTPTLNTGLSGVVYKYPYNVLCYSDKYEYWAKSIAPKGFHVSTDEDWMVLENYLGAKIKETSSKSMDFSPYFLIDYAYHVVSKDRVDEVISTCSYGEDSALKRKLCSRYGWNDGRHDGYLSMLNIKPWAEDGKGAVILSPSETHIYCCRVFTEHLDGVVRCFTSPTGMYHFVIRCVKD